MSAPATCTVCSYTRGVLYLQVGTSSVTVRPADGGRDATWASNLRDLGGEVMKVIFMQLKIGSTWHRLVSLESKASAEAKHSVLSSRI